MQKIKYTCLLLFLLLAFAYRAVGQCPTDTILYFTTQAEVDAFALDYPNCTYFAGDIRIENTEITHLDGLNLLDSIGGNFQIINNDSLLNFSGMESLKQVNGIFEVTGNDRIADFTGLSGLELIDSTFLVRDNGLTPKNWTTS
jgi:hypothetical protein